MLEGRRQAIIGSGGRLSVRATSACWISATACRNSPCTRKPTWTRAAPACWTSGRCCGKTAGPWPARTSRQALMRLNRRARARRSRWRWKASRSAARAGAAVADAGRGGGRGPGGGRGGDQAEARGGAGAPVQVRCTRAAAPDPADAGGGGPGMFGGTGGPIPPQDAAQVSTNWPTGNVDVAWPTSSCRRSRNGPSRPSPMPAAIPARPTSRSRSPDRPRAGSHRGRRTGRAARLYRRTRTTLADRSVDRRLVAHHAEGGPQFQGCPGAFRRGQQFRHAGQVRSYQRPAALAAEDAVSGH